jgi:membrane-bound lytic murein transglycosylase
VQGCAQRTEACDTPLYGVPVDEAHLSRAEGDAILPTLIRARYTRQQVLDGVFEPGGEAAGQAAPLVWLARPHVHEALMQGTIEVTLPDGSRRTFNVDRVNGRPYRRGVPSEEQERFWYFREVDGARGWGAEPDTRIRLRPYAAVAGDAYNLGLGSLFALRGDDGSVRLAVLADTGGAFQPNLYQLDLFTGAHPSREAFEAATADLPRRPHAYLLVAR